MKLKYRNLLEMLQLMTDEELNCTVTVLAKGVDEFFPVEPALFYADQIDVLDQGHPYLMIED
jgi:hypothetical protein